MCLAEPLAFQSSASFRHTPFEELAALACQRLMFCLAAPNVDYCEAFTQHSTELKFMQLMLVQQSKRDFNFRTYHDVYMI